MMMLQNLVDKPGDGLLDLQSAGERRKQIQGASSLYLEF